MCPNPFLTRLHEIACFTFTAGVVQKRGSLFRVPLSTLTVSSMVFFTSGSLWIRAVDDDGLRPVFSLSPLPSSASAAASFIHLPSRDLWPYRLQLRAVRPELLHLLHVSVSQALGGATTSERLEKAIYSIQTWQACRNERETWCTVDIWHAFTQTGK